MNILMLAVKEVTSISSTEAKAGPRKILVQSDTSPQKQDLKGKYLESEVHWFPGWSQSEAGQNVPLQSSLVRRPRIQQVKFETISGFLVRGECCVY